MDSLIKKMDSLIGKIAVKKDKEHETAVPTGTLTTPLCPSGTDGTSTASPRPSETEGTAATSGSEAGSEDFD